MNDFGTFQDSRTVRFERLLPEPIELVWDYLTRPELLADWFAEADIEPREGGAIELKIVVEQLPERKLSGHLARGVVKTWEPPRVLSYTWNDENVSDTLMTFQLEPSGDQVRLALTLEVGKLKDPGAAEKLVALGAGGWHAFLDILVARLRGERLESFQAIAARVVPEYQERAQAAFRSAATR